MKIDLTVINNNTTQTTVEGGSNEMQLSKDTKGIIFKMFTEGVYSDPIGTVVREIASNCFDSHDEAKEKDPNWVDAPVVIKRSFDSASDTHYISFIDYGVGMSPDRVKNVYGVYFESTKRDSNGQIGGFGIGGKTPLAYKRSTGFGEGEFDNSFFVITNYEGMQYYYTIFMGKEAPEFVLLDSMPTEERNGTEVRVPVLVRDWSDFETAIVKQLYYFENVIFEGFEHNERIENEYQIIRGNHFFYRGTKVSNYMHVCIGRVAYPLDFGKLGLDQYDYEIPVALNVPIGDVGMTVSRELLDYSEGTIKYLKEKVELVVEELKGMLAKKYDNVVTLKDYFDVKQNFGKLYLTDDSFLKLGRLLKPSDIDYTNYRYNAINTPTSESLFRVFFNTNVYGKKELKGYSRNKDFEYMRRDYDQIGEVSNVLYADDENFPRRRIVQAYLKQQYGRFYVISKVSDLDFTDRMINDTFNVALEELNMKKEDFYAIVKQMQEEYFQIVRDNAKAGDYTKVDVPEDFIDERRVQRVTEEMKKLTIPVNFVGGSSRQRIKLDHFFNYNGAVFYGTKDDQDELYKAMRTFRELFQSEVVAGYSTYYDEEFYTSGNRYGRNNNKNPKKSAMFVTVAKGNVQYMKYHKNAHHVNHFFVKMLYRKVDIIKAYFENKETLSKIEKIKNFYKDDMFAEISKKWSARIKAVMDHYETIKHLENYDGLRYSTATLNEYIQTDNITPSKEAKKISKEIEKIVTMQENNAKVLEFINMPYDSSRISTDGKVLLITMLKKVMVF